MDAMVAAFSALDAKREGTLPKSLVVRALSELVGDTFNPTNVNCLLAASAADSEGLIDYNRFAQWLCAGRPPSAVSTAVSNRQKLERQWQSLHSLSKFQNDLPARLVALLNKAKVAVDTLLAAAGSADDERLMELRVHVDAVEQAFDQHLHAERHVCPLFEFLSNCDLLELLSTSDASEAQHIIKKLFQFSCVIVNDDGVVVAIQEGDEVVNLNAPVKSRGVAPKVWVPALRLAVQAAIRQSARDGWREVVHAEASTLVSSAVKRPLQVAVLLLNLFVTAMMERAFRKTCEGSLQVAEEELSKCILQNLIADLRDDIPQLQRKKLIAMLTVGVSQLGSVRHVVKCGKEKGFSQAKALWIDGSLRHYSEAGTGDVEVLLGSAQTEYGFEYDSSTLLVRTPLTFQIYGQILCGLRYHAPSIVLSGPAGTGKVEVQRDMAKELGRLVCVCSCSEETTERELTRFLRGAAAGDVHLVMDNFQLVPPMVRRGLHRPCSWTGSFADHVQRSLPPNAGTFVGFSVNSKCTEGEWNSVEDAPHTEEIMMTVPHFRLLVEVMLASEGFSDFVGGAVLVQTLFDFARTGLSNNVFYDFGLRRLRVACSMAGAARRRSPSDQEIKILCWALWSALAPCCSADDRAMLASELHRLFSLPLPDVTSALSGAQIRASARASWTLQRPLAEFMVTSTARHGLCAVVQRSEPVLGALSRCGALTGATTLYLGLRCGTTVTEFFGAYDSDQKWYDGAFTALFRSHAVAVSPTWILIDGAMSQDILEQLHTTLDDNKTLILCNGEVLRMNPNIRVVFIQTPQQLDRWSPASISRLGVINFMM